MKRVLAYGGLLFAFGVSACSGGHDDAGGGASCQILGSCTYYATAGGAPMFCFELPSTSNVSFSSLQAECVTDAGGSYVASPSPCASPGPNDSICAISGGITEVMYASGGLSAASAAQVCSESSGQLGGTLSCPGEAASGSSSGSSSSSGSGGTAGTCSGYPASCESRTLGVNCVDGCSLQSSSSYVGGTLVFNDTCEGDPSPCSEIGSEWCAKEGCTFTP
jgi:hypothetical protein